MLQGKVVRGSEVIWNSSETSNLSVAEKVIHGVVGAVKHMLGIDPSGVEIFNKRLSICESCEHSTPKEKTVKERTCGTKRSVLNGNVVTCGCPLVKKTSIGGEKCPVGKW